jgi:hypothetical protein
MNALKKLLRRWVLTRAERGLLADHADLSLAFGEVKLERSEALEWGKVLATPTGAKIDACMCDLIQRRAMEAIGEQAADRHHACGMAAGMARAWVLAKSLSTMGVAEDPESEDGAHTGAADLDRLNP